MKFRRLDSGGYAYLMVLAAVCVLAILAQAVAVLTSYQVKRDREQELLFRGQAYRRAIQSYYLSSPPWTLALFPRNLQDLVKDNRYSLKRHLRSLYPEPFSGEWGLVKSSDGGICGVASTSQESTLKKSNFPQELSSFEGAEKYNQWIFIYLPVTNQTGTLGRNK